MAAKLKLTQTALRMLDRAVSDALNNEPMDERCPLYRFGKAGIKAADQLVAANLGQIMRDKVFGDRFIVNATGIEYHAQNASKVDAATDPLNIRGATGFY